MNHCLIICNLLPLAIYVPEYFFFVSSYSTSMSEATFTSIVQANSTDFVGLSYLANYKKYYLFINVIIIISPHFNVFTFISNQ